MIKSRKIKLLKWLAGISVILFMLGISAVPVFAAGMYHQQSKAHGPRHKHRLKML